MNLSRCLVNHLPVKQSFSTSACVQGKKTRVPFDKRFPVSQKHVNRHTKGGSEKLEKYVALHVVKPTGVYDKQIGRFRRVQEMVPEFIVPDLKDFKLKPYVSYKVPEVTQTRFTAKDLFDSVYAKDIVDGYNKGEITLDNCDNINLTKTDKT